jgi:hypothetical protein
MIMVSPGRLHDREDFCPISGGQTLRDHGEGAPGRGTADEIRDVDYVDLPTGHWPQFTRYEELGLAILASVGPA